MLSSHHSDRAQLVPDEIADALEWERQQRHAERWGLIGWAEGRVDGAAESTVDALMLSLRERGEAALAEPRCCQRLADLSSAQVREVIARLMGLRQRYSNITDDLLFKLGEQL